MAILTKDILTMVNSMVKEDIQKMMVLLMMVSGLTNRRLDLEFKYTQMVTHMRVSLRMENSMERESLPGLTESLSLDSGKKVY